MNPQYGEPEYNKAQPSRAIGTHPGGLDIRVDTNGDGHATWRWRIGSAMQFVVNGLLTIGLAYIMLFGGAFPENQPDEQRPFWLLFGFFHMAGGLMLLWVLYNATGRTELQVNAVGILVRQRPIPLPLPRFYPASDIVRVGYGHHVDVIQTGERSSHADTSDKVHIPSGVLSIYTISGETIKIGKRIRSAEAGEILAGFIREFIPEKTTIAQDPGYVVAVNEGAMEHIEGRTRWVQPWRGMLFLPFFLVLLLFGILWMSAGMLILVTGGLKALPGTILVSCIAIPCLGGAYLFGALALNRTTIEIQAGGLNVRHHPLPWPGSGVYPLSAIAALQLHPHTIIFNGVPQTTYNIMLVTRSGKHIKLARKLDTEQDARSMIELIAKGIGLPASALRMPGDPVVVPKTRRSGGLKHVTRIRRLPRPRPGVKPPPVVQRPPSS